MSVNKHQPHVFVLPEDDANRQLANGFVLGLHYSVSRKIQVLPVAGGWRAVLGRFETDHRGGMVSYPERFIILLIDFNGKPRDRLNEARAAIPASLIGRVFILGAQSRPEALRASLGSCETIGQRLAENCRNGTDDTWGHNLLRHNANELDRLRTRVRPILFPTS